MHRLDPRVSATARSPRHLHHHDSLPSAIRLRHQQCPHQPAHPQSTSSFINAPHQPSPYHRDPSPRLPTSTPPPISFSILHHPAHLPNNQTPTTTPSLISCTITPPPARLRRQSAPLSYHSAHPPTSKLAIKKQSATKQTPKASTQLLQQVR
jgi:hypothetical protein